jgi:FlaA1/EpsC-like NDP-sugar epimerase
MSLSQTVQAILASGEAELEGRILVPDLGEPTRITDLAELLIGAAGEIPIVFTGCRPGDKLTEELVYETETEEECIEGPLHVFRTCRLPPAELDAIIERLSACIAAYDVPALIQTLCAIVPEYIPSDILR